MKRENAYMTLEAAVVFVIVLNVLFFGIYILFFSYNKCLMSASLVKTMVKNETENSTMRYLCCEEVSIDLSDGLIQRKAEGCLQMSFPFSGLPVFEKIKSRWSYEKEMNAYKTDPVKTIRALEGAKQLFEGDTEGGN